MSSNIKCKVVHSHSKAAWNVIGTTAGLKYKLARVPLETIHLCKCNNCEETFVDMNPQVGAKEYPMEASRNRRTLVQVEDEETNEIFWACPTCKVDDYLTDI